MRHKFLFLTVKKLLKSVYIYGSYRKIKTGLSLFWTTLYSPCFVSYALELVADLKTIGMAWKEAEESAANREDWRRSVAQCVYDTG